MKNFAIVVLIFIIVFVMKSAIAETDETTYYNNKKANIMWKYDNTRIWMYSTNNKDTKAEFLAKIEYETESGNKVVVKIAKWVEIAQNIEQELTVNEFIEGKENAKFLKVSIGRTEGYWIEMTELIFCGICCYLIIYLIVERKQNKKI